MYTIKIHTDNAAFDPCPADEIAKILTGVVNSLARGDDFPMIFLRDCNGNTVGTAEFTSEEDDE